MRKVILYFNMSLDGIVTNIENWIKISDELIEDSAKRYEEIDTILFGGNTYPSMGEYWQNAEDNSDSPTEKSFAKLINDKKKYVISRKKMDLTWRNSEQILFIDSKSLIEQIQNLKNQNGKNISVESGVKTWQFFFENKLYDELWLCLQPIVAGNGEKIFYDGFPKLEMKLKDTTQYQDGVIKLIYERI